MVNTEFKSLGFKLSWPVPATVEEYNTDSKRPGNACLEDAIDTIMYRAGSPEFRDRFLHGFKGDAALGIAAYDGVDKQVGIERGTKVVPARKEGGEATEAYSEPEAVFWGRIVASLITPDAAGAKQFEDKDAVVAHFTPFAQTVLDGIPFDASVKEPSVKGPKSENKEYRAIAESHIAKGTADKLAAKLAKMVGHAVAPTVDALAAAIREDMNNEKKRRLDKMRDMAPS